MDIKVQREAHKNLKVSKLVSFQPESLYLAKVSLFYF